MAMLITFLHVDYSGLRRLADDRFERPPNSVRRSSARTRSTIRLRSSSPYERLHVNKVTRAQLIVPEPDVEFHFPANQHQASHMPVPEDVGNDAALRPLTRLALLARVRRTSTTP